MDYLLSGDFIEACDCYVVCPCWVDDEPDDGHCTGLFAWTLDAGSVVDGLDVAGLRVVAVTTHLGNRRTASSATVVFVDEAADDAQVALLGAAFSGGLGGPLADLAAVSGEVLARERARISLDPAQDAGSTGWTLTVHPVAADAPAYVRSTGGPRGFDGGPAMTLRHTALASELGIGDEPVESQLGGRLEITVGALAGGYVEVSGRSGMRGRFRYVQRDDSGRLEAPEQDDELVEPLGARPVPPAEEG
ncbi:DUF1326 domain-containing protein [Kineosporia sp. A_224]|uniref:DUF1326 domain-containing protein n=1 Tax=Kineosporia sp. A_224 TaxID=1962180 RepID=UPI000B4A6C44|nr:DUF1326 domain-containing protein [Kineosporia sp. A_224]